MFLFATLNSWDPDLCDNKYNKIVRSIDTYHDKMHSEMGMDAFVFCAYIHIFQSNTMIRENLIIWKTADKEVQWSFYSCTIQSNPSNLTDHETALIFCSLFLFYSSEIIFYHCLRLQLWFQPCSHENIKEIKFVWFYYLYQTPQLCTYCISYQLYIGNIAIFAEFFF